MQTSFAPKTLIFILAAYLVLAIGYAAITPYRQPGKLFLQRDPATGARMQVPDVGAPDERQHVNYVKTLLSGKLPVLAKGDFENYQAHQPPLYYLLGAGICKLTGVDATDLETNRWPLRGLNALIGLVTLLASFRGARTVFGQEQLALAATAIVGLMPMFLALHGAASNDPLLFCLCSVGLAMALVGLKEGFTTRRCVILGVVLGLALLTKTSGLAIFLTVGLGLLLNWKSVGQTSGRSPVVIGLMVFVPALLIVGGWWARNQSLYGDPLALRAFNEAFAGSPKASLFIEQMGASKYWVEMVGWWTGRSLIGTFGYMDIFLRPYAYAIALVAVLLLALGGVFRWLSGEKGPEKSLLTLCLINLLIVVALFIQFNSTYFQGQARYLYPAVAAAGIWLASGLPKLGEPAEKSGWWVIAGLLGALNLWLLLSFLPVQFALRMG